MKPKRGIGICHYNRLYKLKEVVKAVQETAPPDARIVVCDDGSDIVDMSNASPMNVETICQERGVLLVKGANLGVAANKNRALWALQDCQFICILEDDLKPIKEGWFETYEKASQLSGCHHFCRVQDKEVADAVPAFSAWLDSRGYHPLFGPSPRGDLTFITSAVLRSVGAFNPMFRGAGYAHGEWSHRVEQAGLIGHPSKWIDIKEARDSFVQIGDREGGRWNLDEKEIKRQLQRNKQVLKQLQKQDYIYHELVLE